MSTVNVMAAVGAFSDGRSGEWGGIPINAGPLTFWLIVALLLVLVVLYRSMRKHLGRVNFEENGSASRPDASRDAGQDGDVPSTNGQRGAAGRDGSG